VNAALRRHLLPSPIHIALVVPDGEAAKEALVDAAPSTKTYPAKKPDDLMKEDEVVSTFDMGITADNVRIVKVDDLFEE
jgi:hypothetical protein